MTVSEFCDKTTRTQLIHEIVDVLLKESVESLDELYKELEIILITELINPRRDIKSFAGAANHAGIVDTVRYLKKSDKLK